MAKIKEIFTSVQGEGPFVGFNQTFVRFCRCNLACTYCDTDFTADSSTVDYSASHLANIVNSHKNIHSVSLTGGEPLMETDFLLEFLPLCEHKIYLETNATMCSEMEKIVNYVDFVSADIKLKSATGTEATFDLHDEFFRICSEKCLFAKIVFNQNISDDEIIRSCEIAKKYDIEIILQPQMNNSSFTDDLESIQKVFDKFLVHYQKVRLIPQMHKFLNVR